MRAFKLRALAIASAAFASIATPSLAGSPYYDAMGVPMTADQAEMMMQERMMDPAMMGAQPRMRGHYTCSPDERRTRLERKACGATRSAY